MRRWVYSAPKGCVPFASTQNNNGAETSAVDVITKTAEVKPEKPKEIKVEKPEVRQPGAAEKINELTLKAISVVLNAYGEVSALLGAGVGRQAVADDCRAYIKGKLVSLGEKGIAAAEQVSALSGVNAGFNQTPVSLKLCMLADKRTDKGYEKEFLNVVTQISESIE